MPWRVLPEEVRERIVLELRLALAVLDGPGKQLELGDRQHAIEHVTAAQHLLRGSSTTVLVGMRDPSLCPESGTNG